MEYVYPHSQWESAARERGFSSKVQPAINRAYGVLRADDTDQRFTNACRELAAGVAGEMSDRQRMDVLYLLGRMDCEQSNHKKGLPSLEGALEIAGRLHDALAVALFAFRIGMLYRAVGPYGRMVEYLRRALSTVHTIGLRSVPEFRSLEVQVCAQLGFAEVNRGNLPKARGWLGEAERVASMGAPEPMDRALVHWAWALVHRWEGHPELALPYADLAIQYYDTTMQSGPLARIRSAATEIVLDYADTMPLQSTERAGLIRTALRYSKGTAEMGLDHNDSPGGCLGMVAQMRVLRAAREQENRTYHLLNVVDFGDAIEDMAVLARACTAMGDEWLARGELGAARNLYVRALEALRGQDMDGQMHWPAQGLARVDRMLGGA